MRTISQGEKITYSIAIGAVWFAAVWAVLMSGINLYIEIFLIFLITQIHHGFVNRLNEYQISSDNKNDYYQGTYEATYRCWNCGNWFKREVVRGQEAPEWSYCPNCRTQKGHRVG